MTVTGGEPPSFPSVGSSNPATPASSGSPNNPLFSPPGQHEVPPPVVTTAPGTSSGRRGSRLRWLVAGLATLLVLAIVGSVVVLAAPQSGTASQIAHYAPADTAMYIELRLDLPGDQQQNLATFMSHFPGFADQSALQTKINDALDTLLKNKTNGAIDWNNDVKPWFGGQLAIFGSPATSGPSNSATSGSAAASNVALVFSVNDKSLLEAGLATEVGSSQPTTITYQGTTISTVAPAALSGQQLSYAVTDDALIASESIDLVKQALDVHAGAQTALANDPFFTQQLAQLDSDRLATFYVDGSKLAAARAAAMPEASGMAACLQMSQTVAGVKSVGELRAESDHLALTVRTQLPTANGFPTPTNSSSNLAQSMPGDAVAYLEMHNTGANLDWLIKQGLDCATSAGGGSGSGGPLASGLGILSGSNATQLFQSLLGTTPDQFLDFVDDAALGVTYNNGQLDGGIVATVDDQTVATQRVDKLTTLIGMLGAFGGGSGAASDITTEQVNHNGTTITVIHYAPSTSGGASLPNGGKIDLAIATTNGKLYLGTQSFVTAALDQDANTSLATNATYQKAIAGGPQSNAGILYLDAPALIAAHESSMTADQKQQFEQNVKPFLAPLSSASAVIHIDANMVVTNGFLYVE